MAKDSLHQQTSAFNSDDLFSSPLIKAQALISVVLNDGLENCSKSVHHEYLSIIGDLINHAMTVNEGDSD